MKFHNSKKVINLNNVDMKKILINFLLVKIKKRMQNTSSNIKMMKTDHYLSRFHKWKDCSINLKKRNTYPL